MSDNREWFSNISNNAECCSCLDGKKKKRGGRTQKTICLLIPPDLEQQTLLPRSPSLPYTLLRIVREYVFQVHLTCLIEKCFYENTIIT